MSLTNDMMKLKETADKLAAERKQEIAAPVSMVEKIKDSYYEKRTKASNDVATVLRQYDFETTIELKAALETMWNEMHKRDMYGFIPVSMVAVAKNKPKQGKQEIQQQISPYIYEF